MGIIRGRVINAREVYPRYMFSLMWPAYLILKDGKLYDTRETPMKELKKIVLKGENEK